MTKTFVDRAYANDIVSPTEVSMSDGAWITTKEAATMLGVSDARVRQMLIDGKLKGKHFGRDWMVSKKACQYLAHSRSNAKSDTT